MQDASKQVPRDRRRVQRVIALLTSERPDGLTLAELHAELDDFDRSTVIDALAGLQTEGVIAMDDRRVQASRCAKCLDMLALICD
jgi:predicted Zn-ribbon and HTH transcriptional regulator